MLKVALSTTIQIQIHSDIIPESREKNPHAQIPCRSYMYTCYSNRTLPIKETIYFVMDNLSIKIRINISLFAMLL